MRRPTTIALAVLLAVIMGAGVLQLFILADRSENVGVDVGDAVAAGGVASFIVQLSEPAPGTVVVEYATADITAVAGTHYEAVQGSVSFNRGERTVTVDVPILDGGDNGSADDELRFRLILNNPDGADIVDGVGVGTIRP